MDSTNSGINPSGQNQGANNAQNPINNPPFPQQNQRNQPVPPMGAGNFQQPQQPTNMGFPPSYSYPPPTSPQSAFGQGGMTPPPMGPMQQGPYPNFWGAMPPGANRGNMGMPVPPVDNDPYEFGLLIDKHEIKLVLPSHPATTFDEKKFVKLLAGSISLTKDEKRKIIESVPRLMIKQISDLISILTDEKQKFKELSAQHKGQLKKLEKQHYDEWVDLEYAYIKEIKAKSDADKAEEIRKKLGL